MAELQSLDKPVIIKTCAHLDEHFTEQVLKKNSDSDELHLVFDRYDIPFLFAGKGKATWRKVFREADEETITALASLGKSAQPTAIFSGIEKLVCQEYVPNTTVNNDKGLR